MSENLFFDFLAGGKGVTATDVFHPFRAKQTFFIRSSENFTGDTDRDLQSVTDNV